MEYPLMDNGKCGEQPGGEGAFICTECGEGYIHYPELLTHMAEHGTVESFPYDCHTNGFGAPLEFALHEDGMLTVVNRSTEYNNILNGKSSSQILPWNQAAQLGSPSNPMVLASTEAKCQESQPVSMNQTSPLPHPHGSHPTSVSLASSSSPVLGSPPTPVILHSIQAPLKESLSNPEIQASPHAPAQETDHTVVISPTKETENGSNTLVPPHATRFQCEICNQLFNTRLGLLRHQRYRTLERGYKCTLCCRIFGEREELRQHLQYHSHERFYSCKQCGKRFLKQEALQTHQDEFHGTERSNTSNKTEGHKSSIEKSYPCKMCGLHFFWLSDLQSHLLSHANGKIVSRVTNSPSLKPFSKDEVLLDSHSQSRHDLPSFKKNKCTDSSVPSVNMSFRPYRCGLCGNRFQQLSDLKKHHLSHQTQDDRVKSEPEPKHHNRSVSAPKRQIRPEVSGKQKKSRGRPSRGSGSNRNSRVYPCKLCHRVFVHSSSLSRHMRYHKGTLHTCIFCGRHFPQRCDVTRHIAMYHHSEVLPAKSETVEGAVVESRKDHNFHVMQVKRDSNLYPCAKCGKEYLSKYELDGHSCANQESIDLKEVTSSPKPRATFRCKDCGKSFGLLCVYQRHQRYHRRELAGEVHKCPHCPRRFRQSSALLQHLNQNHQNQSSGENDENMQTSSINTYSQDATLEQDVEDFEDDDDTDEEDCSDTASAEVLYECTECTETFSSLATFLQHQSAHGTESTG